MLEIRHLTCHVVGEPGIIDVSLRVSRRELVVLHGPNGAGKSTLCRCLAAVQEYQAGEITLDDAPVPTTPWDVARTGLVVLQKGRRVFPELTVEENLGVPVRAWMDGDPRDRIGDVLALFPHLAARLRQRAGTLSGGEQQMVALGRAVLSNPRALVLDEPFLGLAPRVIADLTQALTRTRDAGVAVLVTQEDGMQLAHAADRSLAMIRGRIISARDDTSQPEPLLLAAEITDDGEVSHVQ